MKHKKVAVINIGIGNIGSVINCLNKLNFEPTIISNGQELTDFCPTHILMPGVGSVKQVMKNINHGNLIETLEDLVLKKNCRICGICAGMQILTESSEEFGLTECLGWIPGRVKKINSNGLSVPHIGWNTMNSNKDPIFKGIEDMDMYFAHSYAADCPEDYIISYTNYGSKFVSAIRKNNIYGIQSHPEKSAEIGAIFFKNFLSLE